VTAREAIEKGIRRVRLLRWNKWTYLELPPKLSDGTHGPWAHLYDPIGCCVLRSHPEGVDRRLLAFPIPILFPAWDDEEAGYEEFTGARMTPEDIAANRHIVSEDPSAPESP